MDGAPLVAASAATYQLASVRPRSMSFAPWLGQSWAVSIWNSTALSFEPYDIAWLRRHEPAAYRKPRPGRWTIMSRVCLLRFRLPGYRRPDYLRGFPTKAARIHPGLHKGRVRTDNPLRRRRRLTGQKLTSAYLAEYENLNEKAQRCPPVALRKCPSRLCFSQRSASLAGLG